MEILNGQILEKNSFQLNAQKNKIFDSGDVDERYEQYANRFISKDIRGTEESMPKEVFYPTSDFKDVISEIANQLPVNFNINGKEEEFLRKNMIEKAFLRSALNSIYKEGLLSASAFVVMKPKIIPEENEELMTLELEVLPFENCFPEYDILTGELIKLTYQEERYTYQNGQKVIFLYTVVYTKDSIKKYIRNMSGNRIAGLPDNQISENPFKSFDILPILEFRCSVCASGNPYDFKAFATRLVESQLQIDNLNTNIENLINLHSNPIYIVKNTYRDWGSFEIGAGQLIPLQENEDFDIKRSDMQLVALAQRMKAKKDEIYKTGGLVPPSLRDRMYGTDSSKVVKIACSELIGIARTFMNNFKKPLITMAKALLMLNGKELTNEAVSPPEEVLPYDLESVFATMSIGMNLGLVDDEWFWNHYMPEISQAERERIRTTFKERNAGQIDNSQLNVDNRAKIGANMKKSQSEDEGQQEVETKPAGNKKQKEMNADEKDMSVKKEK